ncbi:protein kinase [Streptomyces sp. NPDC000410]|uniref:protein kinase n=1 Tax=Streptomyces sp. NPDC000410 TaxID=3154254 RepID=UPI00331851E1
MDDYAGRVLADRYRLPLPPSDAYELVETRAFDTYSGQEVLVRQLPLPEVVDAEVLDPDGSGRAVAPRRVSGRATRRPTDPAVRRAVEAAQAAAQIPDHPRLDQVFDVFAEGGSLWIVSELVAARPLAALLAERPLTPYRAAEIGSDVLTALRALHAHGWTHRNITVRTVLVCDDGRVVLTGLAAGAAEEALCGYAPVPEPMEYAEAVETGGYAEAGEYVEAVEAVPYSADPAIPVQPAPQDRYAPGYGDGRDQVDVRTPRPGAIAAYRAGARAGARIGEDRRQSEVGRQSEEGRRSEGGVGRLHHPGVRDDERGAVPAESLLPPRWWSRPADEEADEEAEDAYDDDTYDGPYDVALYEGDAHGGEAYEGDAHGGEAYDGDAHADEDGGDGGGGGDDRPRGTRRALLAGTWSDGPFSGTDGPASLSAGGGASPYGTGSFGADALRAEARRGSDPTYGDGRRDSSADPHSTGPRGTGPHSTGPHSTGPHGTGPHGTGPHSTGPRGTGTHNTSPHGSRPHGTGPHRPGQGPGPASSPPHAPDRQPVAAGRWDEVVAGGPADPTASVYRGPTTPLAAERARQARIAVVGAVTERWAPEQAGPVHENWQLAPPIGPSTDLWALGALLYRAVQGHAPYPEESAAELVQLVCAEPPAFAEECGPLRPVVESLLRQDPTERPDFEELRGWLRSLIRSAPEPEAGTEVVPLPSVDAARLPVVRRRGELVRKRRPGSLDSRHGRHRHKKTREPRSPRSPREPRTRRPRALGRLLLVLILLGLAAAVAYAVMFMPKAGSSSQSQSPSSPGREAPGGGASSDSGADGTPDGQQPQTSAPTSGDLADGYEVRADPEGFRIAVDKTWERRAKNSDGQVRYAGGAFTLIVVPGRDTVRANGSDPMTYQRDKERELQPFRDSSWTEASGLRRTDVGEKAMAEGKFSWKDGNGRQVYAQNLAVIVGDRYHVIQVIGPADKKDKVAEIHQQAATAYQVTG